MAWRKDVLIGGILCQIKNIRECSETTTVTWQYPLHCPVPTLLRREQEGPDHDRESSMPILWRSPLERGTPRSPTSVSRPSRCVRVTGCHRFEASNAECSLDLTHA